MHIYFRKEGEMETKKTKIQLSIYFILTIVITWIIWSPSVLLSRGIEVHPIFLIISMMAGFTPSVVGLLLHRRYLGKGEFKKDMKGRLSFSFSKWWLFVIPLYFALTSALSYGILKLEDTGFTAIGAAPLVMTPLVFLQILFIGGALGEEFGWRGFAQDRLMKLYSPFIATLILGAIWSLWHLPLFFMDGTVQSNIPIWQFMLQNTMIAFYYTWLYRKTKGNLWLMIFLHAVANTASAVVPYWQSNTGRYIGFAVLLLGLLVIGANELLKNGLIKKSEI